MAFLGSKDLEKSREFYENVLGLRYKGQDEYAITFQLKNSLLRINHIQKFQASESTVMGWIVEDIMKTIQELNEKGIIMEKYEFFAQNELGVTTLPDNAKLAYFKDPDGNVLSLTQFP